ncbi:hypothetical protein XELAEV_18038262mg [Xenopus laevis]|uniref:Uncharacterized protein n=1 Tax=Xenopus laevis TaxID=8355 RepID=A0A974H759_XENLA|nr:hypothetical protein XELAEV_18038262mg [Xenopus laevis]
MALNINLIVTTNDRGLTHNHLPLYRSKGNPQILLIHGLCYLAGWVRSYLATNPPINLLRIPRPPVPTCAGAPGLPTWASDLQRKKLTLTNLQLDPKRGAGSRTPGLSVEPKFLSTPNHREQKPQPLIPVRVQKARLKIMDPERVRTLRSAGLHVPVAGNTGVRLNIPRNSQLALRTKPLAPPKRPTKHTCSAPALNRRETAPIISRKEQTEKEELSNPKEGLLLAQQLEHIDLREENTTQSYLDRAPSVTIYLDGPKQSAEEQCLKDVESMDNQSSLLEMEETISSKSDSIKMVTCNQSYRTPCYVQTKLSGQDCSLLQSLDHRQEQFSEEVEDHKTVIHTSMEVSRQAKRQGTVGCTQVQRSEQAEGQGTVDCTQIQYSQQTEDQGTLERSQVQLSEELEGHVTVEHMQMEVSRQAKSQGTVGCTQVEHTEQAEGQGTVDCTQIQYSQKADDQGTLEHSQVQLSEEVEGQGTVDCTQIQYSQKADDQGTLERSQVQISEEVEGHMQMKVLRQAKSQETIGFTQVQCSGRTEGQEIVVHNHIQLLSKAEDQEAVDHIVNHPFICVRNSQSKAVGLSSDSSDSGLDLGCSSTEGVIENPEHWSSAENQLKRDNIIRRSQGVLVLTNSTDENAIFIPKLEFAFTPDSSVDYSVLPQPKWNHLMKRSESQSIYTPRGPSLSKSIKSDKCKSSLLVGGRSENYPSSSASTSTNNRHLGTTNPNCPLYGIVDLSLSFRDKFLAETVPSDIPKILLTDEENEDD